MNFTDLPDDIHYVLSSYLYNIEVVSVSQTCQKLRHVYGPLSWATCLAYPDRETKWIGKVSPNVRVIPLGIFNNPNAYPPWFYPQCVSTLIVACDWFKTVAIEPIRTPDPKKRLTTRLFAVLQLEIFSRLRKLQSVIPSYLKYNSPYSCGKLGEYPYTLLEKGSALCDICDFDIDLQFGLAKLGLVQASLAEFMERYPGFHLKKVLWEGGNQTEFAFSSPLDSMHSVTLSLPNDTQMMYALNAIRPLPNIRALTVHIWVNGIRESNELLTMCPSVWFLNNVPDGLVDFKLAFFLATSTDNVIPISLATAPNGILTEDAPRLTLSKVTEFQNMVLLGFRTVFNDLFPYIWFPNLQRIYSQTFGYEIKIPEEHHVLSRGIPGSSRLVHQYDTVTDLRVNIQDLRFNEPGFLSMARAVVRCVNVTKLSVDVSILPDNWSFVDGASREISGIIKRYGLEPIPFSEFSSRYQDDQVLSLLTRVVSILNDKGRSDLRQISVQQADLWHESVSRFFDGSVSDEATYVTFSNGLVSSNDGGGSSEKRWYYTQVEWDMYLVNYMIYLFHLMPKVTEFNLSFGGPFFPPLDWLVRMLEHGRDDDYSVLSTVNVMVRMPPVGKKKTGAGMGRKEAVGLVVRSLEYLRAAMEPSRRHCVDINNKSPALTYQFDVGMERFKRKMQEERSKR